MSRCRARTAADGDTEGYVVRPRNGSGSTWSGLEEFRSISLL